VHRREGGGGKRQYPREGEEEKDARDREIEKERRRM
jgi:hypothetical protein